MMTRKQASNTKPGTISVKTETLHIAASARELANRRMPLAENSGPQLSTIA